MRILLLLAATVVTGFTSADESILSPTEMRRITSDVIRSEAVATTAVERADALVALCDTYVAIRMHPHYEQSEILRGEGARVRRRLITANRKLTDQLERAHVAKPAGLSGRVDAALVSKGTGESSSLTTTEPNTVPPVAAASEDRNIAGPGGAGPGGAGPGGADEPWALVELIQRTIRPDFWEVTGGPGTIRYFAMRRVLVVRATTQVHEEVAALLRRL